MISIIIAITGVLVMVNAALPDPQPLHFRMAFDVGLWEQQAPRPSSCGGTALLAVYQPSVLNSTVSCAQSPIYYSLVDRGSDMYDIHINWRHGLGSYCGIQAWSRYGSLPGASCVAHGVTGQGAGYFNATLTLVDWKFVG